jgi:hypothetical protein
LEGALFMSNKNNLTQDQLRKKLDGFKIEVVEDTDGDTYKTIDKGVYMAPDDQLDRNKKNRK